MIKNILVVCVGNICRSPIGEALLQAKLPNINISSAGISALINYPADPQSISLMEEQGIDISAHRARQINNEMILEADLILTMEKRHNKHIQSMFSGTTGKVHLIGKWLNNREIPDPFRKSDRAFRIAMENIEKSTNAWVEVLSK